RRARPLLVRRGAPPQRRDPGADAGARALPRLPRPRGVPRLPRRLRARGRDAPRRPPRPRAGVRPLLPRAGGVREPPAARPDARRRARRRRAGQRRRGGPQGLRPRVAGGRDVPLDLDGPAQVAHLARRVAILSRDEYAWDGEPERVDPSRLRTPVRTPEPVVAEVASRLYHEAYGRPHDGRGAYAHLPDQDLRRAFARAPVISSSTPLVRVYWHLAPQGAAPLLAAATRALRKAKAAFMLKLMDDPQSYRRADSAVLYVPAGEWPRAAAALPRVHAAVAPYLRRAAPLFTLRLAPGVGLAEDPGGDESFGLHRSRLVAEGLFAARGAQG